MILDDFSEIFYFEKFNFRDEFVFLELVFLAQLGQHSGLFLPNDDFSFLENLLQHVHFELVPQANGSLSILPIDVFLFGHQFSS